MKTFAILATLVIAASSSPASTSSLEKFSPHFSTNTPILWTAATNHLPKTAWVYRRLGSRIFPATVISNAIVLASLQSKGFPQPSTNQTSVTADEDADCPCGHPCVFCINPDFATISYSIRHPERGSGNDIPSDETVVRRAWECAVQLGLDPKQLQQIPLTSHFCDSDEIGRATTNHIGGRGECLSRQLDGICFWGSGDDNASEGLWIEFGSHGAIRSYFLNWPNLKRHENQPTASPQQIIACIRAQKIIVVPNGDEEKYFERVEALATAKMFTITKITPYYNEGVYGEAPTNNLPSKFIVPVAELEAVADFGSSNQTVRIFAPFLQSDIARLLADQTATNVGDK